MSEKSWTEADKIYLEFPSLIARIDLLCRISRCTRSEEHTSELQSRQYLVCRLLLEKKKKYVLTSVRRTLTVVISLIAVELASVLALQAMPVEICPLVGNLGIYVSLPYGTSVAQQM